MSRVPLDVERLLYLSETACDECISESELTELDTALLANDAACRCYLDYYRLRVALRMELRAHQATRNVRQQIKNKTVLPDSSGFDLTQGESSFPGPFGFLSTAFQGTIGYFSHEIPFSFLIGAVLTSLLVLVAWLVPVSSLTPIANTPSSIPSVNQRQFTSDSKIEIVGKITGMVDCKWADINTSTERGNSVLLGRKYTIASGLLEITYNTGAKVILQGPVTYEVESNGGYLAVGKLTGKLEKKEERVASSNSQSLIPDPFVIRTPTAVVTDLGTEFGVKVTKEGTTTSHVFRGSIRLQAVSGGDNPADEGRILHENQSARVAINTDNSSTGNVIAMLVASDKLAGFVREIPRPAPNKPSNRVVVVAHWKFDGNNFLADSSGNGHALVNNGAAQVDNTASFNGNASLSSIDSIDLTPYCKVRVSWSQKAVPPLFLPDHLGTRPKL